MTSEAKADNVAEAVTSPSLSLTSRFRIWRKGFNKLDSKQLLEQLYDSCKRGDLEKVKLLIKAGVDLNGRLPKNGYTALILAATAGHLEIVKYLIRSGANLDDVDKYDRASAAIWAAHSGHLLVVKALFDAGADVTLADKEGHTALTTAATKNNMPLIGYLLGLVPRIMPSILSLICLHLFCARAALNNANLDCVDGNGRTSLIEASARGQLPSVEFLCANFASIDLRDNEGVTAALAAARYEQWHCLEYLIGIGARLDIPDDSNFSVIDIARVKLECADAVYRGMKVLAVYCHKFRSTLDRLGNGLPRRRSSLNMASITTMESPKLSMILESLSVELTLPPDGEPLVMDDADDDDAENNKSNCDQQQHQQQPQVTSLIDGDGGAPSPQSISVTKSPRPGRVSSVASRRSSTGAPIQEYSTPFAIPGFNQLVLMYCVPTPPPVHERPLFYQALEYAADRHKAEVERQQLLVEAADRERHEFVRRKLVDANGGAWSSASNAPIGDAPTSPRIPARVMVSENSVSASDVDRVRIITEFSSQSQGPRSPISTESTEPLPTIEDEGEPDPAAQPSPTFSPTSLQGRPANVLR